MPDLEHEPEPVSVEGGYQAYLDLGPTPPQALYPGGYKSIDATQKVIRNDDAQELGCAPEVSVASDHARPLKVDPSICGMDAWRYRIRIKSTGGREVLHGLVIRKIPVDPGSIELAPKFQTRSRYWPLRFVADHRAWPNAIQVAPSTAR